MLFLLLYIRTMHIQFLKYLYLKEENCYNTSLTLVGATHISITRIIWASLVPHGGIMEQVVDGAVKFLSQGMLRIIAYQNKCTRN